MAQECLSDATVLAFVRGRLDPETAEAVEAHIAGCGDCRSLVAEAAKATFGDADEAAVRVSRYRIVEAIGVGGAGVVYRAHDPELDRMVALKVLPSPAAAGPETGGPVLTEARAMARLVHPNVVSVFDAGSLDGGVFIAMELVEGETLGQWLGRAARGWREVLAVLEPAGRGLAAAHAAGIIHGDFKPDNVLLGSDGRVRVADFGLARSREPGRDERSAGVRGGTPAFMAPEQLEGKDADARSDQFSFAVTLWFAVCGQLPFGGGSASAPSVSTYARRVLSGKPDPPPAGHAIPPAVVAVIERGLRPDPVTRYASMEDLLTALGRAGRSARRRELVRSRPVRIGALAALIAGGGLIVASVLTRPGFCGDGRLQPGEACDDGNRIDDDGCSSRCVPCTAGDARFVLPETGHCYTRHDTPRTFNEARGVCRQLDGDLVVYTRSEIRGIHAALLADKPRRLWIGITGPRSFRPERWLTHELLEMPWWASPPVMNQCVAQVPRAIPGNDHQLWGWESAPCSEQLPFVCEQTAWTRRPGRHAYRVFTDASNWETASANCARRGGRLVVVDDREEMELVLTVGNGPFWVGARRSGRDLTWTTGGSIRVGHFGVGEPDGNGECLLLDLDHAWHDKPCKWDFPYMCEMN